MGISDWSSDVCSSDLVRNMLSPGDRRLDRAVIGYRHLDFAVPRGAGKRHGKVARRDQGDLALVAQLDLGRLKPCALLGERHAIPGVGPPLQELPSMGKPLFEGGKTTQQPQPKQDT